MRRASFSGGITMIVRYIKFLFATLGTKVYTLGENEVDFLRYFYNHKGLLSGVYSLAVDMEKNLLVFFVNCEDDSV